MKLKRRRPKTTKTKVRVLLKRKKSKRRPNMIPTLKIKKLLVQKIAIKIKKLRLPYKSRKPKRKTRKRIND